MPRACSRCAGAGRRPGCRRTSWRIWTGGVRGVGRGLRRPQRRRPGGRRPAGRGGARVLEHRRRRPQRRRLTGRAAAGVAADTWRRDPAARARRARRPPGDRRGPGPTRRSPRPTSVSRAGEPALYDWSAAPPAVRGEPFGPPELEARVRARRRRGARPRGEPPAQRSGPRRGPPPGDGRAPGGRRHRSRHRGLARRPTARRAAFTVTLTHGARDTTAGTVALELPAGWPPVAAAALPADPGGRARDVHLRCPAARRRPLRVRRSSGRWPRMRPAGDTRPASSPWTIRTSGRARYLRPAGPRPRGAAARCRRWRVSATSAAPRTACRRRSPSVGLPVSCSMRATLARGDLSRYRRDRGRARARTRPIPRW